MALETIKIKKGATFYVGFDFEGDWDVLYPWESIEADVSQKGNPKRNTDIVVDPVKREITVIADTSEWSVGAAQMDIRIVKGNRIYVYPQDSVINILVVDTVTLGDTP